MRDTLVMSSLSCGYLADLIAKQLEVSYQTEIERRRFGDGEHYLRIGIDNRQDLLGKDVVYVAATHNDQDFLELYRVGAALAGYGTRRRIFVVPFFGYSTMERAVRSGEVVTAKTNARILSTIPNTGMGNAFLMMDLHTAGIVHYFEGDCLRYELYAEKALREAIANLGLNNFMFASADLGRPRWVQSFANHFGTDVAFISKSRDFEETKILAVVGNVEGRVVIIYDDMTRSGGTLIQAAEAYLEKGAESVYAVLSHLALNDTSVIQKLLDSPIAQIITTNSHPMSQQLQVQTSTKFEIVDTSFVFSDAIKQILG